MRVVSGMADKGTSYMKLSGGKGLGRVGAQLLANLLLEAPPALLYSLDLRHLSLHPSESPGATRHLQREKGKGFTASELGRRHV